MRVNTEKERKAVAVALALQLGGKRQRYAMLCCAVHIGVCVCVKLYKELEVCTAARFLIATFNETKSFHFGYVRDKIFLILLKPS